jgi:hypothetical protein
LLAAVTFGAVLYVALLAAVIVEIFVFNHYEGALGNQWDNFLLNGALLAPFILVAAIGYLIGLTIRHRVRGVVHTEVRHAIVRGLIGALLSLGVFLVSFVLPESSSNIRIAAIASYLLVIGVFLGWLPYGLPKREHNAA